MARPGNTWPEERVAQLCAMLAARKSFSQIADAMGISKRAVDGRVKRLRASADPRLPVDRPLPKRIPISLPADFAEHAHQTSVALQLRYNVGRSTIQRFRLEIGMQARTYFKAKPVPENFANLAPTLTLPEAREVFGAGDELLRRWEALAGVKLRRRRLVITSGRLKMDRDNRRDMSRAGLAADYLRRFSSVFRCDAQGKPSEKGTHWARGRHALTGDEIIDRAMRLGWQPDAWRTVTTPTTTEGARA